MLVKINKALVSKVVLQFEKIFESKSIFELTQSIQEISQKLGFESFHYGAHAAIKPSGDRARFVFDGTEQKQGGVISSYPDSWFKRYQEKNYIEIDPLVAHCSKSIVPVSWGCQKNHQNQKIRNMFDEATEHGLANGATFSVIGKSGELSIFSLTTSKSGLLEQKNTLSQLGNGYIFLACIHEAVCKLGLARETEKESISLTSREKECLTWVSIGKTSWEISVILGISESTIIFHISNAGKKLQTSTRSQAVAKAISLGLIAP